MKVYMWDAGVVIGYTIYVGEKFNEVVSKIDSLAINCNKFVHNHAKTKENYIPSNSYSEVKSRLNKNSATFNALISLVKTGKFEVDNYIDVPRLLDLQKKLAKLDKVESIKSLIQIQSVIYSRFVQVNTICKIKKYYPRIEKKHENELGKKLTKKGDMLNFSSTIHFHNNESECTFITTDKEDFYNLDLSDIDWKYTIPNIEFVQDY